MRKIIRKSPWGDYVGIEIRGKIHWRTALGHSWCHCPYPSLFMNLAVWWLRVSEIQEDAFSKQLSTILDEPVYTNRWAE